MPQQFRSVFLTISVFLVIYPSTVKCAPSGNIQLAIASPDPVKAGDKITFQNIILNTGAEKWDAGDYFTEIEIYDKNRNYIRKAGKTTGKTTLNPGETALVYTPFSIPTAFEGDYFYKITLTLKEQRIIVSEYYTFTVIPLSQIPKPPSKISFGGNAILSWKQTQREYKMYGSSSSYTGSLNINMVGKAYDAPVSLNLYALYDDENDFDLDNFLLTYYGNTFLVALGDIQPAFNSLVLYGAGVRGLNVTASKRGFSGSVVVSQSAEKSEGTSSENGVYARYLWGGEIKQNLGFANSYLSGAYTGSKDDDNSLDTPGPSLLAAKNDVVGGSGYFEMLGKLGIKAEYAQSQYKEDISSGAVKDTGIKATASIINSDNLSLTGIYSKANPDFTSLGAPSSSKDKESYEISTAYNIPNWSSISVYLNKYSDNLAKDPNKTTSTQNIASGSISLQKPKFPIITLGYSLNSAVGDPKTALNNQTDTPSFSISHTLGATTLSASLQRSKFKDKTGVSDELKSDSGNFGIFTQIGQNLSVTTGATFSTVYNLATSTDTETGSYSISVNYNNLIKDKLSSALWGSYTTGKDKPQQSTNTENLTGTLEFTYNLKQNLSATLGFTHTSYTDDIYKDQTYKENSGNIRCSMSF